MKKLSLICLLFALFGCESIFFEQYKIINPKIYKMNDIGLIFSVLDGPDKKPGVNQRIRKNHYTKIRAPLIINKSNLIFKEDITL